MPLLYDDERQNQRDYEYMKSVYPGTAKRLMPYIEEECDRLEYMGSVMYDEYPDRLQLLLLCRRIYNRAKADETKKDEAKEGEETGEWLAMPQARSQAMHYMKGLRGAASLRRYCSMLEHFTDVDKLIDAVYRLQE